MTEIIFAAASGALLSLSLCLTALCVFLHKKNEQVSTFLQSQAIDERNERFHEVRSLLTRLHSTPSLKLDSATPDVTPIEDPTPYISDFPHHDEAWEEYVESTNGAGPAPVITEGEDE
jgi:hypothetical protein